MRYLIDSRYRVGVMLALAALLVWPVTLGPGRAPYPPGSDFSDLVLQHWPLTEFVRLTLQQHGQWPLWNPTIFGGQPLAADPLVGMWYPPNWLLLLPVLPLPLGFNLLFLAHLAWAGWCTFGWQQAQGRSPLAALLAALLVMGLPKLAAHYGAGHVGLTAAVCWTPALLWTIDHPKLTAKHGVLAGLVLALIFLADVRWAVYAGVLLGVWWLFGRGERLSVRMAPIIILALLIFILLGAILWLPLAEFVQLSARQTLSLEAINVFALGASDVLGVLLPRYGSHHELQVYLGWPVLALAVIGALWRKTPRRRFWVAVLLFCGWWALGAQAGLFAWVYTLAPQLALLRVPSRAWFIVGLAVAILAAAGVDRLQTTALPKRAGVILNLSGAGLAVLALGLGVGVVLLAGDSPQSRTTATAFISSGLVIAGSTVLLARKTYAGLLVLVVIDFMLINGAAIEMRHPDLRPDLIAAIDNQGRVYSPSVSLPPLAAVRAGIEQVDGVNPLQLARAVELLTAASGVPRDGYRETIPSFDLDADNEGITPYNVNADYVPDAELLGILNTRWVVSEFPLQVEGLEFKEQVGTTYVYFNTKNRGWAWHSGGSATIIARTPDRVVVDNGDNSGRWLVLSQMPYPWWYGEPFMGCNISESEMPEISDAQDLYIIMCALSRKITFEYRPLSVYLGATLSILGLLLTGGILVWISQKQK